MFVHNLPKAGIVRIAGHTFKHHRGAAISQGTIDGVTVPSHPTHIGGAPINVAFLMIKNVFVGHGALEQVATGGVQNPFGFTRRARCIEYEQRSSASNPFSSAMFGLSLAGSWYLMTLPLFLP